jgi:uncharacterized iron-regulated membrane protein
MPIRKVILNLHLCAGVIAAVFLLLLGLSGSILVFENQIDRAINGRLCWVPPDSHNLSLSDLKASLERSHPGYHVAGFSISERDDLAWSAFLDPPQPKEDGLGVAINPHTGAVLGTDSDENRLVNKVHQFHTHLLAGQVGSEIMGWAGVFLLLLSLSGLILWWPRKIFTVKRRSPGRRMIFDLHNTIGIYSSIFLLIFAATGIVIHWEKLASTWANHITHSPSLQPVPRPEPPPPGAVPIDPDRLLAIAAEAAPGARPTVLQLADSPARPVRIIMKYPEDHTPAGRTNIYLDSYSGKVLAAQVSRTAPVGFKITRMWNREIHTGDILGWPTQILACLVSLMLPVMSITGPLIWWTRRRKRSDIASRDVGGP